MCTACVAGKYKPATGAGLCTDCTAGKYSTTIAATVACDDCPLNSGHASTSQTSINSCACNMGATGSNGACSLCVAGKYKAGTGADLCTDCSVNTHSATVGATLPGTCLACGQNSQSPSGSVALTDCICNLGYTGPNGGTCTACGQNSQSPSGSLALTDCICNLGYTGPNGGTCAACEAGKYKPTTGSGICTDCGAGKHSASTAATVETACSDCPENMPPSVDRSSCQCGTGYTGTACIACVAGKYKSVTGAGSCTDCTAGKFSNMIAASAEAACTVCAAGKYVIDVGASICLDCGQGRYKATVPTVPTVPVAAVTCSGTNCGSGCIPVSGATSGTISDGPGDYQNIANCWWLITTTRGVQITLYFQLFNTESGYDFVKVCAAPACDSVSQLVRVSGSHSSANFYPSTNGYMRIEFTSDSSVTKSGFTASWTLSTTAQSLACDYCPLNSGHEFTSQTSIDSCVCNMGATGSNGGPCFLCVAGKYKSVIGSDTCINCGAGKFSASTAATAETACSDCPGVSTSTADRTSCQCNAGYTGIACIACVAGKYKSGTGGEKS